VGKHFTVNHMVAKESVKARFDRPDQGISYAEFSYMLLQAYDFLQFHQNHGCDLQIGGSDQWGNITMGIELIRKTVQSEAFGLTTPLVVKADGTKFGKTESGTVWLDAGRTSPYRLYQFFFNVEDAVVGPYLRYFTFLDHEAIIELDKATADRPSARAAQRALARAVCELVHGADEVDRAEVAARALFGEAISTLDEATLLEVVDDAPSHEVPRRALAAPGGLGLIDALVESGLASSKGEARRVIAGGGAYVNNRPAADDQRTLGDEDLLHGRYVVLRKGKRDYHLLVVVDR
jgi:tyrosyl-tRNA synthetase